jgi:hypothetical protein
MWNDRFVDDACFDELLQPTLAEGVWAIIIDSLVSSPMN